jgi:UDP-glucose 4-epimerase
MKILITGGAGFLGSHLSERCLNEGFYVNVIDNLSNGSLENIKNVLHMKNFKFLKGDIREKKLFKKLPKDYDIVFHLAANQKSTKEGYEANLNGTKNLLEFIRKECTKVKKVIYTSSTRAMGLAEVGKPLNENSPCRPDTLYGKSKYECEKMVREFGENYGIKTIIFRFPRIYGPRDWQKTFYYLIKLINFGIVPSIDLNLNLIYVKNLVHALLLAINKKVNGTFIVTDGPYKIDEITSTIKKILKKEARMEVRLPRKFFKVYSILTNSFRYALKDVSYSIEKIKKEMSYKPVYTLEKGVFETIKWYKII